MAFEETVTIINNSGKIISTGRQLLNIWKEASTKYTDRRQAIKHIRKGQTNSQPTSPTTPTPGIKRAQTFSAPTRVPDAISEASSDASEEQDFVPPLRKRISYYPDVDSDPKARAARLYLEDDNKSFISLRSSSTRASKSKKRSSGSSRRGTSSVVSSSAGSSSAPSTVFSAASSASTGSALTASALRAHNANPPPKYRAPYAETAQGTQG